MKLGLIGSILMIISFLGKVFASPISDKERIDSFVKREVCALRDYIRAAQKHSPTTNNHSFNKFRDRVNSKMGELCFSSGPKLNAYQVKSSILDFCKESCKSVSANSDEDIRSECVKTCAIQDSLLQMVINSAHSTADSLVGFKGCSQSTPGEGSISDVPYSDPSVGVLYPEPSITTLDQYFGSPTGTGNQ